MYVRPLESPQVTAKVHDKVMKKMERQLDWWIHESEFIFLFWGTFSFLLASQYDNQVF